MKVGLELEECPITVTSLRRLYGLSEVYWDARDFREVDSMEGIDELIQKALDRKPELQPA